MKPFTSSTELEQTGASHRRRSISALLEPLEQIVSISSSLCGNRGARFHVAGEPYEMPRYLFIGPRGGDDPIRIGIFAVLHGDEPEGAHAIVEFVRLLERSPEIARGYCLFLYPMCNPTGYEDSTRVSRRGRDLNREFWNQSSEPEVQLLESELSTHAFHGIISLHSDDTSHGLYGFASGATLTRHLLEPALVAAGGILPRNDNAIIDGFEARQGIIREGYRGVLCVPPGLRPVRLAQGGPAPFEVVFETPQAAPQQLQVAALVVALQTMLSEYRNLIAFAANL